MTSYDHAFAFVIGHEGGYTANPADPGNWTGGRINAGECRGTKFGISAGAYPDLDIVNLTEAQASDIYRRDYWAPIRGDELQPPLALLVFDAAVNNGMTRAIRWLQEATGVKADGVMGPATLQAIAAAAAHDGGATVCAEFLARRLTFTASLPTWASFGAGWSRRLCRLPFEAMRMET